MKKQKRMLLWIMIMVLSLTACANMGEGKRNPLQESRSEKIEAQDAPEETNDISGRKAEWSKHSPEVGRFFQTAFAIDHTEYAKECIRGSAVVEDETAIYICGNTQIIRMDKQDGSGTILWQSDIRKNDTWEEADAYCNGNALLIGNRIYFTEKRDEEQMWQHTLSTICTDGTGYMRLEGFPNACVLLYADGVIYVDTNSGDYDFTFRGAWQIQEDGRLEKAEHLQYPTCPKDYRKIAYIPRVYTIQESLYEHGYCLWEKQDETLRWNPETEEGMVILPKGSKLKALNKTLFLSEKDNGWYLTDALTLETVFLAPCPEDSKILVMDEEYIYTEQSVKESDVCIYERISLKDGSREELFREDTFLGYKVWSLFQPPSAFMPIVVQGNYLYHAGYRDDKLYLMRRDLTNPAKEQILGPAYCDRCVSPIGHLEIRRERTYDETDTDALLAEAYIERLKINESFPGADKINSILEKEQEHGMAEYDEVADMAGYAILQHRESGYPWKYAYSVSSRVEICYSDTERYLSFYQSGYMDAGGPHGVDERTGYTFDLLTGRQLTLSDIIDNDSQELKEIVMAYFTEYIQDSDWRVFFWEDALERVQENTGFDMDFYLTEEGICFYFPPYELGGYVLGFVEGVIPYSEWKLKLPLGENLGE